MNMFLHGDNELDEFPTGPCFCSHVDGKILQSRRNQALRKCQWYCEWNKRSIFVLCQWCASRRSMRTIQMSPNRAKLRFFCKTLRHMEFPMQVFFLNLRFLPPKSKSIWSGFYAGLASNLCDTRQFWSCYLPLPEVPNAFSSPLPSPVNPVRHIFCDTCSLSTLPAPHRLQVAETPAVEGTARIQDSEACWVKEWMWWGCKQGLDAAQ